MSVHERLALVRERIADAAIHSGRIPGAIRLVGVSKGMLAPMIAEAVEAGLEDVGENRVQEAAEKIPSVDASVSAAPRWHLVGHLQTNKVRAALGLFDTIQSIDSVRVAQAISHSAARPVRVFLEVQFAHTPDRFGFDPDGIGEAVEAIRALPSMDVVGLMTVAPLGLTADETRRIFRTLRERRDALHESRPSVPLLELSMGMSEDFPLAIEEGATVVRIGRAIFAA
ncbi:MAG: YggS family pyridoxal phosphate-dependent enzyme [Chloroflexi bacterium]|nr:YggS family pyridoxal phosphate-dependent enzyme [Chloroflexota bacterium]